MKQSTLRERLEEVAEELDGCFEWAVEFPQLGTMIIYWGYFEDEYPEDTAPYFAIQYDEETRGYGAFLMYLDYVTIENDLTELKEVAELIATNKHISPLFEDIINYALEKF